MNFKYYFPALIIFTYGTAYSAVYNNDALLLSDGEESDLSYFNSNSNNSSEYFVSIYSDGQLIEKDKLINLTNKDGVLSPCLTSDIIDKVYLTKDARDTLKFYDNCAVLSSIDKDVTAYFDNSNQTINISIPQKFQDVRYRNWTPPELRDNGIPGFIFDYNVVSNTFKNKESKSYYSVNAYGNTGVNLGAWRFRAQYQYENSSQQEQKNQLRWNQVYTFRDISSLSARLLIGKINLATQLFDSVRFNGVSLATNESMIPPNLRGYATQISGVAATNATVILMQNDRILSQTKVPAGPFIIRDLDQSISGTIDVTVIEEDGSKKKFQVTTTNLPFLTRMGEQRFKINAGQFTDDYSNTDKSKFISTEYSYGLLNNTSVYGGVIATTNNDYLTYTLGIGQNLNRFGALSFDVTQSKMKKMNGESLVGESYSFNYAKEISEINGQITLAGYRFATRDFNSLTNYLDYNSANQFDNSYKDKHVITLSYSQQLPMLDTSLSVSVSRRNYWNGDNSNYYSVSGNKSFETGLLKNSSVSLSFTQSKAVNNNTDNQFFVNFTKRFESSPFASVSYFGGFNRHENNSNTITYSDKATKDLDYNVSISNQNTADSTSLSSYITYRSTIGESQLSTSLSDDYKSASLGFNGSLTATQHGVDMHPNVFTNQPRLMVKIPGVQGIEIKGTDSVTNQFGIATISNTPAYYNSEYYIDINKLPDDVNMDNSVISTVLTEGAIGYYELDANVGQSALVNVIQENKKPVPFGSIVYDLSNKEKNIGMVSEFGQVYISGLNKDSDLTVRWGKDNSCKLNVSDILIENKPDVLCRKNH